VRWVKVPPIKVLLGVNIVKSAKFLFPDHSPVNGLVMKTKCRGRPISIRWAAARNNTGPCTGLSEPTKYHVFEALGNRGYGRSLNIVIFGYKLLVFLA
jgi:hypothetical protein